MDFIDVTEKIAKRSDIRRHKTGAIIVNNYSKEIVSNGWSHVPHYKLHSGKRSLHAEMHALSRARHLDLWNGPYYIYIVTVAGRSGNIVGAKPCLDCAIALQAAGIAGAYYSFGGRTELTLEYLSLTDERTFDDLKVYERNGD